MSRVEAVQAGNTGPDADQARVIAANPAPEAPLFMRLLVAQIQSQDPLSPMESKDFVQQFAAMSQVQSMQRVAQDMERLVSMTRASVAMQESLLALTHAARAGGDPILARADGAAR